MSLQTDKPAATAGNIRTRGQEIFSKKKKSILPHHMHSHSITLHQADMPCCSPARLSHGMQETKDRDGPNTYWSKIEMLPGSLLFSRAVTNDVLLIVINHSSLPLSEGPVFWVC